MPTLIGPQGMHFGTLPLQPLWIIHNYQWDPLSAWKFCDLFCHIFLTYRAKRLAELHRPSSRRPHGCGIQEVSSKLILHESTSKLVPLCAFRKFQNVSPGRSFWRMMAKWNYPQKAYKNATGLTLDYSGRNTKPQWLLSSPGHQQPMYWICPTSFSQLLVRPPSGLSSASIHR